MVSSCFFFNDTATTEIYTLSLHDALPICPQIAQTIEHEITGDFRLSKIEIEFALLGQIDAEGGHFRRSGGKVVVKCLDRKSTRLNSSHANISYAVFCLKKKRTSQTVPR